jgi:hypothetical protein
MSIINDPGKADQRPELERIQDAKGILNSLVNRNLISIYEHFNIHDLFKELDGQEKQQAFKVADLIEKILLKYNLIKIHPQFNLRYELTQKGRRMMDFEYFFQWEEEYGMSSDNSSATFVDKSVKINGDNNKVAIADDKAKQNLSDSDLRPDLNPTEKLVTKNKMSAATVLQEIGLWIISNVWQFVLLVLAAIVASYMIYKWRVPH